MPAVRANRPLLGALLLGLLAGGGCKYEVRVGAHDAGTALCAVADACGPCDLARAGDSCPAGHICQLGPCEWLECVDGRFRHAADPVCVGDAGTCSCATPPSGCYYDRSASSECSCGVLTCVGERERCGRVTCGEGSACCSASCGLCTPSGDPCPTMECPLDCAAQDARGDGACGVALGIWTWTGRACEELYGCSGCVGADCPSAFAHEMECLAVFGACTRACSTNESCEAGEYCDYDGVACGGLGLCRPRPSVCPPVLRETCGCDGRTYASPCDVAAAGTDTAYDGACGGACAPDAVEGDGACDLLLGFRWTGRGCEALSGCDCLGAGCDLIRDRSEDACLAAHAECTAP